MIWSLNPEPKYLSIIYYLDLLGDRYSTRQRNSHAVDYRTPKVDLHSGSAKKSGYEVFGLVHVQGSLAQLYYHYMMLSSPKGTISEQRSRRVEVPKCRRHQPRTIVLIPKAGTLDVPVVGYLRPLGLYLSET